MKLVDGNQYRNITSLKEYTLRKNNEGFWYLESDTSKGEAFNEKDIARILNSKFLHIVKEAKKPKEPKKVAEATNEDISCHSFYTIKNKDGQYYNALADTFQDVFKPNCIYTIKRAEYYLQVFRKVRIEADIYNVEVTVK